MPPHVLQFEAMWSSDKLAACASWAQAEYAWLYGLADVNGSFELTNLRVLWGKVAAIRKELSIERLEQVFEEFVTHGLLFVWERDGKKFGHWTGSDQPGRLLPPALRKRYRAAAPSVPKNELRAYLKSFSQSQCNLIEVSRTGEGEGEGEGEGSRASHAPSLEPSAPRACPSPNLNTLEQETKAAAFEFFWERWPRREAKAAARRAWAKIPIAKYPALMAGLEMWRKSDQWTRGIIPHPATWLNGKRWEDEIKVGGNSHGSNKGNRKSSGAVAPPAGKYEHITPERLN